MEPTSIGTVATVLAKKAGEEIATAAKTEAEGFLRQLFGPMCAQIGENWALLHKERKFNNLVAVVLRAKRTLSDAGLTPHEVPLKIIDPLLESAALEEEPDLQGVWGNLLANAADFRQDNLVSAAFPSILRELSGKEVKFLDILYAPNVPAGRITEFRTYGLLGAYQRANGLRTDQDGDFAVSMELLKRHQILVLELIPKPINLAQALHKVPTIGPPPLQVEVDNVYRITALGVRFIAACRPPVAAAYL